MAQIKTRRVTFSSIVGSAAFREGIAEQITRDGGQTTFHNATTGEHWKKAGGVWRRVKQ